MPIHHHRIICTQKRLIAKDTYELRFTKPEHWTFQPGQFLLFDVPLQNNPADIQTRAFSVGSRTTEAEILLAVKLKSGGRAGTWIKHMVEVGSVVTMQGAFGHFLLPEFSEKPYIFLATGAGIAPFRAQILELMTRGESLPIDLIFGVRDESEIFWREEFETLARAHPRFSFHLTLTQGSRAWTGHRGRVQSLVQSLIPDIASRYLYACGNPDMTKEVKRIALEEWMVPKQDLHVEGFI